ncbi:MAG: arsenic efflux protein [Spirochaetales bacterium]|nr:arsenic efflux protein [Spirochaetales bacterium]
MVEIFIDSLKNGIMITVFVFIMMMITDFLNVLSKGKLSELIKGNKFRQYVMTSFFGSTPGCLGAFLNVSFYIRGLITFGAITGGMIATSGDEAFVMFTLFPKEALLLTVILFVIGILSAFLIDKITPLLKIKPCVECKDSNLHNNDDCRVMNFKEAIHNLAKMSFNRFLLIAIVITTIVLLIFGVIGPETWDWMRIIFLSLMVFALFIITAVPDHYLIHHIYEHIFKKHLWKIFLWTFGILLIMNTGLEYWNLETFIKSNMAWIILIAAIVGLIPESGPHLIFVMLFSKSLVPFSVLLVSSIVQDGHGMLPLLSYSIKDSLFIKLFNLIIGLSIGYILFFLNL